MSVLERVFQTTEKCVHAISSSLLLCQQSSRDTVLSGVGSAGLQTAEVKYNQTINAVVGLFFTLLVIHVVYILQFSSYIMKVRATNGEQDLHP